MIDMTWIVCLFVCFLKGGQVKVVSTVSVGYDHIDVSECKRRGILLGNTPGVLTDATADITVGLLVIQIDYQSKEEEKIKK